MRLSFFLLALTVGRTIFQRSQVTEKRASHPSSFSGKLLANNGGALYLIYDVGKCGLSFLSPLTPQVNLESLATFFTTVKRQCSICSNMDVPRDYLL